MKKISLVLFLFFASKAYAQCDVTLTQSTYEGEQQLDSSVPVYLESDASEPTGTCDIWVGGDISGPGGYLGSFGSTDGYYFVSGTFVVYIDQNSQAGDYGGDNYAVVSGNLGAAGRFSAFNLALGDQYYYGIGPGLFGPSSWNYAVCTRGIGCPVLTNVTSYVLEDWNGSFPQYAFFHVGRVTTNFIFHLQVCEPLWGHSVTNCNNPDPNPLPGF